MSEKQKTLELIADDQPVSITVQRASAVNSVKRYQLMTQAELANKSETDEAMSFIRLVTYPMAACATIAVSGMKWPMTAEEFAQLPEDVYRQWLDAVYLVNPQWMGKAEDKDTTEKK